MPCSGTPLVSKPNAPCLFQYQFYGELRNIGSIWRSVDNLAISHLQTLDYIVSNITRDCCSTSQQRSAFRDKSTYFVNIAI